jgi:hypothetical protein
MLISSCGRTNETATIKPNWSTDASQTQWRKNTDQRVIGSANTDGFAFYAFSQVNVDEEDLQIYDVRPDINIRAWQRWRTNGLSPEDYKQSSITSYRKKGIKFVGGSTASVVFSEEPNYENIVSRDSHGQIVNHDSMLKGLTRASLANPEFRNYLTEIAKQQIDIGVDGLFFDEVGSGYGGSSMNGNEGFDSHHLTDFNRYLCEKFSRLTGHEIQQQYLITEENELNCKHDNYSPTTNFDYRAYLANHGFLDRPLSLANPLAELWGTAVENRPNPTADNFVEHTITKYWHEIVVELRDYARRTQDKEVLITANGIYPFTDFQSVGLYPYNHDNAGEEVNYVPVIGGRLDGSVSLQRDFERLKKRSLILAGDAPVTVFLDWPTAYMDRFYSFTPQERIDYLKLYVSEAYANGLFFALPIRTSMPEDPTADELGLLDFISKLGGFFRQNKHLYIKTQASDSSISLSAKAISSTARQSGDGLYILHLVNHNYVGGIIPQRDLEVSFEVPSQYQSDVTHLTVLTHDAKSKEILPVKFHQGKYHVTIPILNSYLALVIEFNKPNTGNDDK